LTVAIVRASGLRVLRLELGVVEDAVVTEIRRVLVFVQLFWLGSHEIGDVLTVTTPA